ncbi:MAG: hypothetical protein MAG794_00418 [Gammaproteobacteria bacterium]|nr:hypothetical protein [Gammaproteobacteria bacterium]
MFLSVLLRGVNILIWNTEPDTHWIFPDSQKLYFTLCYGAIGQAAF